MAAGKDTPKDQEKEEPSTSAVRRGSKSIWPWKKETDGSASFLRAARAGNLDKVLEFLKTNTDINTCNANGLNALHLASKEGHTNVVSALIERNANVDSATKKGNTALHIASLAGQDEIVKVLVESGATVNIQSQNGFTPLYMAAQENHDSVVRFLLAHGANQSLATEDGFTPLAVALQQGHDRVVSVLLENDTRGKVRLPALHIAAKKDDAKAAALLLHTDHNPDITSKSGFTPLHIASHYGNDNIAALLIQRGADVNYVAKHQITPLHVASKWGKGNMVSLLLDKGANIEAKTRDGLTPLHCAARSGHETVVDMLLEKGAPITAKTKNGLAPLHMASQGDHVDAARILLYHKAPVDDVTVDFLTALHVAAHCGHVRVAKLLLDRKADPNARALNGFTPLHIACKKNRIKVVELLLKHGASIEATTESGLTPLHVASFMGCMNIVIYLIQHGASADVPTVRGESPLHLAARANQTDIIRILLRNGAEVDAKAREQQTALHIASRLGNTDIVGLLLQQGASVDAPTKDLYTPLHIAAKEGQEEVAGVLLDHGASLNTPTKKGFTPLHLAAKYGHMKVARLLLQREAPVDPKGKNGVTPLHVAAHYDHQNVAMLLLDKGAQPHATAKNGYTPLHIAARKNQMDIAGTLLEYGANANAESKAGFTPLHLSAQEGHKDMATLLLEHGAQAGGAAKNGLTPLHLCAQEDRVPVAAVLVKHGASVDAQTKAGYTPLHVASHFGQMNMVRFLLQHGTEVDASTQLGYTPLHQAAQQGHTQIVNLLLENKAQPNMETNDGKTALSIAQRLGYISVVETLKVVTETRVTTNTTTTTEEKYKVVVPETMHETFMSESEDEGADDTMLGDQSYRYLTVDEMKSLGDDSLPIDVTRDEKMDVSFQSNVLMSAPGEQHITPQHKKELLYSQNFPIDNVDVGKAPILAGPESLNTTMNTSYNPVEDESLIVNDESRTGVPDRETTQNSQFPATVTQKSEVSNIWDQFLVSFMVDARGGAMRGCRHSGVRVIIPPRKAAMPMRITCRYLKKDKLVHAPPLMEGEALASRILEMGPSGAKFLGPVIIEVPHFASLRGKEREIVILRSDNGETWREHTLEATEEAVQEVLNESFDGEELKQLEDLNTNRITRILTTDFPQYFAIVTRIRQEVHAIGPEGGMVSSTVVPQVQAVFPQGALTKKIKVGLQAQPISTDLVAKLLGNRVAVSPIVTVEPRRRKFHKPITLTIPVPQAASKGMINQYSGEAPTLRLLCSITGGTTRAQWEDVTGSTPLTFVNDCVSFTTTVSARFWLMDCTNIPEATKMATELYREAIHVPFMAKFVVFGKRHQMEEARVRVFCMTDDKEDKTLESQEHFIEVAKSRDVEVLEGKSQYLEFAGNLIPVTKSGDQLAFNFYAFRENRLPFTVRVKDQNSDPVGRVAFMRQPKVGRGDAPQNPICNLNLTLPDNIQPEPAPSEPDLLALEKKYAFLSISKADTIHKADLRLSDISNMLTGDWVALAKELEISDSDINIIKSQYPDNIPQQAIVMLRLWMQTAGNKATGNTLEKALRSIHRDDIVDECICNVEVVTDDSEKATAEEVIDRFEIAGVKADVVPEKTEPSPPGEICYEEKDMMKEAESADEEEISHKIRPDGFTQPSGEPSQMVHGDTAPLTDVKPSVTATELDASQTKPTEKETEVLTTAVSRSTTSTEDVGVVFTELKEIGVGEKLSSETKGGQISSQTVPSSSHTPPSPLPTPTPPSLPLQDDSRHTRRHERAPSQATNVISSTVVADSSLKQIEETETSVEDNIKPYSERKQFWETVTSQSFETKSPVTKSETESDTDTGTDGTVIEKGLSLTEPSDSEYDSSHKRDPSFYENVTFRRKDDSSSKSESTVQEGQDLPSPDDISLKDVKTKKEMFEKEIKRQSSELEESLGWKRSSKEFEEETTSQPPESSVTIKETVAISTDVTTLGEKHSEKKVSEEKAEDKVVLQSVEKTENEKLKSAELTKEEKQTTETIVEGQKVLAEKEVSLKRDLDKEVSDDLAKTSFKSVEEKEDGSLVKTKVRETSKAHKSHEQLEGKSETVIIDYDTKNGQPTRHEQSSVSTMDFTESSSSNVIKSETKFGMKSALGVAPQLSSTETTDSNNGSFERSDSTKESFERSFSQSGTGSSLSKNQSTLTSSADEHDLSEFPDDSSRAELTSEDESNKKVEKKIEEERRRFGDTEELLVREITTTREGDQEQRVIKETKTQETLMPDGSTVKTTSVTTFTTQLDRNDSEDTVEHSEDSASGLTEREKSEIIVKQQIKADMISDAMQVPSDELSPERKLLSPEESKPVESSTETTKTLASPIHVPEESVQDIVWEVSQEQSEGPLSETVQYIPDEQDDQQQSSKSKSESDQDEEEEERRRKIILSEEEAREIAREIVEEVKAEALKRSPFVEKEVIINRVQIEDRVFLPKPSSAAAFTTETSDKIEKYIQEQLSDESLDEKHISLIESVAAKKTEMLQKRLGGFKELQLSLEITDEDLKSSGAELSPIETHMERLRQMTEEEETKSGREPSEADESESSMIIHDSLDEIYTSGYDQANQMFSKTLDTVKSVNLKGERVISTICEETDEIEKQETKKSTELEKRKKSREELTEAAIEIVREVTDLAKESDVLKQISSEVVKEEVDSGSRETKKPLKEDLLRQEKSLDVQMESSMTESVEECSAAESTRAYDSRFITEISKSSIQEIAENGQEKKPAEREKTSPPAEEIRLRKKKTHIDEFNRRSGTDLDAYSSSGESHYFTAAEGTDSRSVSRPCSSDVEALLSGTPGTSEYDTAPTSQDGSQYSSSREFSTAPSDLSSRDSMKSIDSESSGNLGSIELSSEASETLVPSALDLEKDMEMLDKEILEEEILRSDPRTHGVIPQLTIQSETPKSESIPSPFETETDDTDYQRDETSESVQYTSSKMKRSMEMTFHPEPKILLEDDPEEFTHTAALEESTVSDLSVVTVVERERIVSEAESSETKIVTSISKSVVEEEEKKEKEPSQEIADKSPTHASEGDGSSSTTTSVSQPQVGRPVADSETASQDATEKKDDSFFRTNGPTEVEHVSYDDNAVKAEGLADAPICSDELERLGAAGSHSVGPDSSFVERYETEADQEYGQMIREGEDQEFEEELQKADDSQPEDEIDTVPPLERPRTPEPGSVSKLRISMSQDSEELTEVDKRFSAIFSVTYEEPASPAPSLSLIKEPNGNVPDITITEHMAPIDTRYRYPDLECEDEFPECRANGTESGTHSTPSSVTSPKSSTTDSEHGGREYCLDSQTEGPVQHSDSGSFELVEAGDIGDVSEYEHTMFFHEKRLRDLTIKEEDEVSSQGSRKEDSPVLEPPTLKAVKLESESPSSSGDGDVSTKDSEEPSYGSSIEEQRKWLEMQFEESNRKPSDFDFNQQGYVEHIFSGPLEDIEEEREDFERRDLSHVTKTPSLSSTPEYDVLAGRKFFTRSGEHDDVSMSSLQEFENYEREVAIENATRRSSSGSQESLNGKRPGSGNKSLPGDDISVSSFSSLNEFERLEKECMMIEQVETKVKPEEQILSEIEEGHESQVSESESCETISEAAKESPDNYEQKIFEIDEIIRQAQTNVEQFEKDGVSLRDIVGVSVSTDDRTPSAEPEDSLEEPALNARPIREHPPKRDYSSQKKRSLEKVSPDGVTTSSDSLESKAPKDGMASSIDSLEDHKRKSDPMSASVDSIEAEKRDLMATSADSLGRDDSSGREGDISSSSDRIGYPQTGVMEWSSDSLEPTSSQATHATYQYETDSVMSGSFTSGCSTTLMPSVDEIGDLMSTSLYLPEGELPDDTTLRTTNRYEWTKVKPEGIIKEVIEESSEPEFSKTVTRTVALPPDVKQVTFTGPDAHKKLDEFMTQFQTGEHTSETETVDDAGNVHIQKVVQKRITIDPTKAEEEGLVSSEPQVEESVTRDEHGNVTRVVRRTVISTHTVEIDLDTGEPIIKRESSCPPSDTSSSSFASTSLSSHPSGPPSGSHSPRQSLPTSLEPNTASGEDVGRSTTIESYGDLSDGDDDATGDDEVTQSLITITNSAPPSPSTNNTISTSSTSLVTSVDPISGDKTTVVTTRIIEERNETEGEEDETYDMSDQNKPEKSESIPAN